MIKKLATIFIAIVMIVVGFAILAHGQDVNITDYNVTITTNEDSYSVVESLTTDATSSETIIFWIQDEATDVSIIIDGNTIEPDSIEDNKYSCNISELDPTTIEITYNLGLDTFGFVKTIQYNTTSMTISFDGTVLYRGSNLASGSSLNVPLQKTLKGPTETVEVVPIWYYIIIIVLIIIVLLSFVFPSKKQKATKKKETAAGSEELLSTKKTLLMELLKEIEKQHRAKQISDDTYHKLKEQYKQEAVDAMKKLEDTKSKVK